MEGPVMRSSAQTPLWIAIVALALVWALPAAAQETVRSEPASPTTARADDNLRLFQQFFTDAAVTNQWWEAQVQLDWGAVPPLESADGFLVGGVVAISPTKDVEVGGRMFFQDYDLN